MMSISFHQEEIITQPSLYQIMSLLATLATTLNKPTIVAAAGVATAAVFPMLAVKGSIKLLPLAALQMLNLSAFALNCVAVSVPGRIDGLPTTTTTTEPKPPSSSSLSQQHQQNETTETCRLTTESSSSSNKSDSTNNKEEADELRKYFSKEYVNLYSPSNGRSLISPAGWAFAIWGPIYIGEAMFCCGAQFMNPEIMNVLLPSMTIPFVAANVFQSLWCAAFRPAYYSGGTTAAGWISPFMLAGTALSLSQVHAAASASGVLMQSWYVLPLTMHFGWTTAATLVNINGALAAATDPKSRSDCMINVAVGHGSAVVAAVLGVAITLLQSSPAYGMTIAWALAACADGMNKRLQSTTIQTIRLTKEERPQQEEEEVEETSNTNADLIRSAILVQNKLCWTGAAACCAASIYALCR